MYPCALVSPPSRLPEIHQLNLLHASGNFSELILYCLVVHNVVGVAEAELVLDHLYHCFDLCVVAGEHDVARLDVTVHPPLLMKLLDILDECYPYLEHIRQGKRLRNFFLNLFQVGTKHLLHYEVLVVRVQTQLQLVLSIQCTRVQYGTKPLQSTLFNLSKSLVLMRVKTTLTLFFNHFNNNIGETIVPNSRI